MKPKKATPDNGLAPAFGPTPPLLRIAVGPLAWVLPPRNFHEKFGSAKRPWADTNCSVVILRDGPQSFAAGEPLRPSRNGPT